METLVHDPDGLRALAAALGRLVASGDTLALVGDLGAGKTVFVQGLAAGLGFGGPVTSPTFTLIHVYEGGAATLFHADLYRLEHEAELENVGVDDIFRQEGVAVVEWADRFPGILPADHLEIRLEVISETQRRLVARPTGERAAELLAAWRVAAGTSRLRGK